MPILSILFSFAVLALTPHATPASRGLPIGNDSYASARADALRRYEPIFIETWAPW